MTNERFPKSHRLLSGDEFDRVFNTKCSVSDRRLVIYGAGNDLGHSRLGLVVSRKVGTAVIRNRWKRLMREAFRLTRVELPEAIDFVLIPRHGVEPDLEGLKSSLLDLTRQVSRKLRKRS